MTAAPPPFDTATIAALRALTDDEPEAFAEVMGIFLEDAAARMAEVRIAASRGDVQAVAHTAHSLSGSAATMGAVRLADVCREIERLASRRREVPGSAIMAQLDGAFRSVKAWLGHELDRFEAGEET